MWRVLHPLVGVNVRTREQKASKVGWTVEPLPDAEQPADRDRVRYRHAPWGFSVYETSRAEWERVVQPQARRVEWEPAPGTWSP
jgi:hypothetical protein